MIVLEPRTVTNKTLDLVQPYDISNSYILELESND